ncbi:MAG: hypothetical protein BWY99_02609 [Synergistetes bacterium ADurb.BinA166]|nr:MAG: hypothetical protein BWY99_02609 [Synergistetes bacterium ADurb.BinA166]
MDSSTDFLLSSSTLARVADASSRRIARIGRITEALCSSASGLGAPEKTPMNMPDLPKALMKTCPPASFSPESIHSEVSTPAFDRSPPGAKSSSVTGLFLDASIA